MKKGMACNSPYTCSINLQSSKYIINSVNNKILAPLSTAAPNQFWAVEE